MLLVRTKVQASIIHGIGLFADEFIAKGTIVCSYRQHFDLGVYINDLFRYPVPTREFIKTYSYFHNNIYYLNMDNARFLNHSDNPNIISAFNSFDDIAAKDIQSGEELTVNYYDFDENAKEKLCTPPSNCS